MNRMPPLGRRHRIIVNTDAKNEADDQYAIVHALLSPSLDVRGIVAAHFGQRPGRSETSMLDSRAEIDLILDYMQLRNEVRVENGAPCRVPDMTTPVPSAGAELIIEEALRDNAGPLFVSFLGPLTDMAAALLMAPEIATRDVTVVWVGGPPYDADVPVAHWPEFNLSNDVSAANIVFGSEIKLWQVPMNAYATLPVSYAELHQKVAPCGELGAYLVQQLIDWNDKYMDFPMEFRSLGDQPAIGLVINPGAGRSFIRPAPEFTHDCRYNVDVKHRPIRVYETVDARFILEDFFAKLQRFHESAA
jgi:inosine-uridine nucleoside N-ribohydrolase